MKSIQNTYYLAHVVDETLRLNCPVDGSLLYISLEEFEIRGVPIPENSLLRINFVSLHFDVLEWHQPKKFLPERFDPESDYFTRPNTKRYLLCVNIQIPQLQLVHAVFSRR